MALLPQGSQAKARHQTLSYERWVAAPSLTGVEQRALSTIKQWASASNLSLNYEPRLSKTARLLSKDTRSSQPFEHLRRYAHSSGMTDGLFAATRFDVPKERNLGDTMLAHLSHTFPQFPYNRVGVTVDSGPRAHHILVVFSRHLVQLHPTPSQIPFGETLTLRGSIKESASPVKNLSLVTALTDGSIHTRPLTLHDSFFYHTLSAGERQGIIDVQLLLDHGEGPEVALHFPIGVQQSPWAPPLSPKATAPTPHTLLTSNDHLAALLQGSRRAEGLPALTRLAALDAVARAHAWDMTQHSFFSHVSVRSGSLTDRLHARGILFQRALENLAAAKDVPGLMTQWLSSPSHRQNILDPKVTSFGVAVMKNRRMHHTPLTAVVVFTQLGDGGNADQLRARAYELLLEQRRRADEPPLRQNPQLERLAIIHSETMGNREELETTHPSFGNLEERIMQETTLNESAANIYRTTTLTPLKRSEHLKASFQEVGIGIYRDPGEPSSPLWITVIYGNP